MVLSKRALGISPSATLAVTAKAKEMKKRGIDVVGFGAGEPDFDTPEHIKEAAREAMKKGQTKYTPSGGTLEMKEAVVQKFKRENGIDYSSKEVMVSNGGKQILYNALQVLCNEGENVILPTPYWVSYEEQIKLAGAEPRFIGTDARFKLSAEAVAEKIDEKTKAIILTSPNNPTGAVIDERELKAIAELAAEKKICVISDEVYEHFAYAGKIASIASFGEEIKELTLVVNAVSKTYSMTGWRIGYCAGAEKVIKAMDAFQSHITSNPCSIAQAAAIAALNGPQEFVGEMVRKFEKRRNAMVGALNKCKGMECTLPEGAFYAFPSIAGVGMDSMRFSERLLEEAKVAVVPGAAFGSDEHVRLSYATSMENIEKGIGRIREWAEKL
ncbi:MAG: pyridoxal phosphate-dependent aminotransferase [Candidatus Micrarchaeota archaeon]